MNLFEVEKELTIKSRIAVFQFGGFQITLKLFAASEPLSPEHIPSNNTT